MISVRSTMGEWALFEGPRQLTYEDLKRVLPRGLLPKQETGTYFFRSLAHDAAFQYGRRLTR